MKSNKQGITTDVLIQQYIVASVEYLNCQWVQEARGVNKQVKESTTQ